MLVPLDIKTDYSLLQSMITVKKLVEFLKSNNILVCAITDVNLFGSIEFYDNCKNNGIKPIIGLKINLDNRKVNLYAEDYLGYQNLLKINTIMQERDITITDLKLYQKKVLCIIPFLSSDLYDELKSIYENVFVGYNSEYEKNNALVITRSVVYVNEVLAQNPDDTNYIKYLRMIAKMETISNYEPVSYEDNYLKLNDLTEEDILSTKKIADLCNLEIPKDERYIPRYDKEIKDSYEYLVALSKKGLQKRIASEIIPDKYYDRLKYELNVIKNMGYVDYFLIVYDYVKYAKQNNILVGPGRGSAAGSLVAYSLGIINIDPLEYDLLFERFLNPERITMPDIDIDFEYTKRHLVIDYVANKYGKDCVAPIITFGTLKSKQALRDTARVFEIDLSTVDKIAGMMDSFVDLKTNLKTRKNLYDFVNQDKKLRDVYRISMKLENLKRQASTHASGVVISSLALDKVIPIHISDGIITAGVTMEFLEDMGLLKMDFLALRNLTIIQNVIDLINNNTKTTVNLNTIPLDDKKTLSLFEVAMTVGIFQYESVGMKNFLMKLKASSFTDLIAAVALFRPGPMENIDTFIARKEGSEKILYPHETLEPILKDTYGIVVYQEQIMLILVKMAKFTFAEADNIRRAMSKKKKSIIEKYREKFILQATQNGYEKKICEEIYELIMKFANYGFNKSHAVSYALIGYQMGYLKSKYPLFFIANLLNMSIGSDIKTKEYLDEARINNITILKPDVNLSGSEYVIKTNSLVLPFSIIKNVGSAAAELIFNERKKGDYKDFFDFVARVYGKSVTKKTIECLIDADVFTDFGFNHATLYNNVDAAITYAELVSEIDESLVMKPEMEKCEEYSDMELMNREYQVFGFYVTNHPSSKYNDKSIVKLENIKNYFDKYIKTVVIVNSMKKIKTKNNEEMAFLTCADETSSMDFVIFPKKNGLLSKVKKDDLSTIYGQVVRRADKYQIVVSNIEKIK